MLKDQDRAALQFGIEDEDVELVKRLLRDDRRLLREVIGSNGRTAMHLAACCKPEITQVMIDLGVEIDIDTPGHTPLFDAVCDGPFETAELLLSHGANPNCRAGETTPIFTAAMARNPEQEKIVGLLVAHGAIWDLHSAVAMRNDEVSRRLLAENPRCLEDAPRSLSILSIAVWPGRPLDIVRGILELGANPDGKPGDVSPLVSILGLDCDVATVELLLAFGADANALTPTGDTALAHYKKHRHDKKIIDLLVQYGAQDD